MSQIKFLTLYTQTVKALVSPRKAGEASLSLVIGTSNSLYKVVSAQDKEKMRVNAVIIHTWLEMIKPLAEKIDQLCEQIGDRPAVPSEKSDYLRFEIQEKNIVAQVLLKIFEQFDRALIVLDERVARGFDNEKYQHIVSYFSDKIREVMSFPYQPNADLNKKLMQLNS